MKILLVSHGFAPQVGGIETMSLMLARQFVKAGHEVKVVTHSPSDSAETEPYEILRSPSKRQLVECVRWCEVVFHNNICLQFAWPLFFTRRPWVVAHHTWIRRSDGSLGRQDKLKRLTLRRAKRQIAVSKALAADVGGGITLIGNCYDDQKFVLGDASKRDRDLVFLGRLVSDKGADLAIEAVAKLRTLGVETNLTIMGTGEEDANLKRQVTDRGLEDVVRFTGSLTGQSLVSELQRHEILVVPSRWKEPFGLVALEGAACGCVVVGSDGGGLKDAIGPCGLTFPNGDLDALVERLKELLTDRSRLEEYREAAPAHLAQHRPESVVAKYLAVLQEAIG